MRVIHLLRKYDPAEWGGTETAVQRLCEGLRQQGVCPVMYCPYLNGHGERTAGPADEDQNVLAGTHPQAPSESPHRNDGGIKRFKACVPAWGISRQEKRQL